MANKQAEYATLRTEILDYWKQQEQLLYATVVVIGATLLGVEKLMPEVKPEAFVFPVALLMATILHFLLYLILQRSISNYERIFRIGAYLRVFHDREGDVNYMEEGAWHHVWRDITIHDRFKDRIPNIAMRHTLTDARMIKTVLLAALWGAFFLELGTLQQTEKIWELTGAVGVLYLLYGVGQILWLKRKFGKKSPPNEEIGLIAHLLSPTTVLLAIIGIATLIHSCPEILSDKISCGPLLPGLPEYTLIHILLSTILMGFNGILGAKFYQAYRELMDVAKVGGIYRDVFDEYLNQLEENEKRYRNVEILIEARPESNALPSELNDMILDTFKDKKTDLPALTVRYKGVVTQEDGSRNHRFCISARTIKISNKSAVQEALLYCLFRNTDIRKNFYVTPEKRINNEHQ